METIVIGIVQRRVINSMTNTCLMNHYDWHECGVPSSSTTCDDCGETKKCFELKTIGSDLGIFCDGCYNERIK